MTVYAVICGKKPGVYANYFEAKKQTIGYQGAWLKKCKSEEEANALIEQHVRKIIVYTDGSKRSANTVGWGVFFPRQNCTNEVRLSGAVEDTKLTNHDAELLAIIAAIEHSPCPQARLLIRTDSKFCIDAVDPLFRRRRAGRKPLKEQRNIEALERKMRQCRLRPELKFVKGHATSKGNIIADQLAKEGVQMMDEGIVSFHVAKQASKSYSHLDELMLKEEAEK